MSNITGEIHYSEADMKGDIRFSGAAVDALDIFDSTIIGLLYDQSRKVAKRNRAKIVTPEHVEIAISEADFKKIIARSLPAICQAK